MGGRELGLLTVAPAAPAATCSSAAVCFENENKKVDQTRPCRVATVVHMSLGALNAATPVSQGTLQMDRSA